MQIVIAGVELKKVLFDSLLGNHGERKIIASLATKSCICFH